MVIFCFLSVVIFFGGRSLINIFIYILSYSHWSFLQGELKEVPKTFCNDIRNEMPFSVSILFFCTEGNTFSERYLEVKRHVGQWPTQARGHMVMPTSQHDGPVSSPCPHWRWCCSGFCGTCSLHMSTDKSRVSAHLPHPTGLDRPCGPLCQGPGSSVSYRKQVSVVIFSPLIVKAIYVYNNIAKYRGKIKVIQIIWSF